MRYLLQAKAKWQANDGKLSYDFTDRLFKTAHSPQVAKIIEQSLQNLKNMIRICFTL